MDRAKSSFVRATKQQIKLRMAIDGPSGSGKTFTGLVAATALAGGKPIAVIDTEAGSAKKYADMFTFDVLELTNFHPQHYIDGIRDAEDAGYAVILIDSLSHAWEGEGGLLEEHEKATAREPGRNSYTAWRSVTPIQRDLVEAMLQSRCHIIATMRSKMEYLQTEDSSGKKRIEKVGMAPIQRAGMEYEFDVGADMDLQHNMIISKSRCFAIADQVANKPTAKWFDVLRAWLGSGAPVVEQPKAPATTTTTEGGDGHATEKPKPEAGPAADWTRSQMERDLFKGFRTQHQLTDDDCKRLATRHQSLTEFAGKSCTADNPLLPPS